VLALVSACSAEDGAAGFDEGAVLAGTAATEPDVTPGGSSDASDGSTEGGADAPDDSSGPSVSTSAETSEGSSSGEVSSSGETGGAAACPERGPPPGPAVRRFDVATLHCGADQQECPADDDQCFCLPHFELLNVAPPHFMSTGTDSKKELVWGAGNFQSAYVDDLNANWSAGGQSRADEVVAQAEEDFDCGAPSWFIVNEISAGLWPTDADYREFVVDFATAMDVDHDKNVVIAAPFDSPGNHAADWSALAAHAYVAAEVYLSGKEVNASGNSVAWCEAQYQDAALAYAALGVGIDRLFLVEHFGQTPADKAWGRAGVSVAGWHNAIAARSTAAKSVGFAGFVSYAWSWNLMHESDANRIAFTQTYVAQDLP
jgi:hypothetical protein